MVHSFIHFQDRSPNTRHYPVEWALRRVLCPLHRTGSVWVVTKEAMMGDEVGDLSLRRGVTRRM